MKIAHLAWLAGSCGRLTSALAGDRRSVDGLYPEPQRHWPQSYIQVCNGPNFSQECGKVDMTNEGEKQYLGKCKTIPFGVFYSKVMSARFVGYEGGCCELFDGINCIGSRVIFDNEIPDLYGHCGFEGNSVKPPKKKEEPEQGEKGKGKKGKKPEKGKQEPDKEMEQPADGARVEGLSGKTKSFACYRPQECKKLRPTYNGTDCRWVAPYSEFFDH
ncbi:hypothetical protein PGQ11_005608 [Apiospora arundinis]|uniref:Uncharacterized protein n=1 Tax=Apiospora arundinis TaxID=335852 RepID=A0ABR2JBE9_9PEZI